MTMRPAEFRRIVWNKYGFRNLLAWLLVYMIVGPILEPLPYAHTLMAVLMTVALFSSIYAVNKDTRLLSVAISLLVLTLILMWISRLGWLEVSDAAFPGILALYLGTLVYSFLHHIISARRVDGNVICAALCTYMVLGLFWGALFNLLEKLTPNSFAGGLLNSGVDSHDKEFCLQYFSFVTMSTLGYGDITPQTRSAAALCQAEAVLGQFFTVALVARLVGVQVAQDSREDKSRV